jgi:hypothetical protein
MRTTFVLIVAALAATGLHAAEAVLELFRDQGAPALRIWGSRKYDWFLEASPDLRTWSVLTDQPPLLANRTNPPVRRLSALPAPGGQFYRARQTEGLYDLSLLRTISLTFTQANWQTLLTQGRTTGSNTPALLDMDNGARIAGVGARYRGNTSFTGGPGGSAPAKKSLNLELDFTDPDARLLGYRTLNLNNAYGDETLLREPLFFSVMRQYAVCPRASLARLYINGAYWGVYSCAQQQNSDLVEEWFPSTDGDRWRAPNIGGGGGGFSSGTSALSWLGTNLASYRAAYELKTDNSTNAWQRLTNAIYVLNRTPTSPADAFRDALERVLAVDRWLWFLALENLFADDDSYWNKGADYMFYYEPESGRLHPIEHDGNEAFVPRDATLSPVQGATAANRPVLQKLLGLPELRQRYLAHLRTALEESFHPARLTPQIDRLSALSLAAIAADPKKGYTMTAYSNDLRTLKTFITNRYNFLTNHAELRPRPPVIEAVHPPQPPPVAGRTSWITATVRAGDDAGVDSVWLYHRSRDYGRFAVVPMLDDGAHGDGAAGDGVYGAAAPAYLADTRVRYYVEARAANAARAASFAPPRAEEATFSYRVGLASAPDTPVVLNEFMAANTRTLADPQGDYDDWIELRNLTDAPVDLSGWYLTDNPNNPRQWAFPPGTIIPPAGYLLVWADEDVDAPFGLHAAFKLSANGEAIYLLDTDANFNVVRDRVVYGPQAADQALGRPAANPDLWTVLPPSPGLPNP